MAKEGGRRNERVSADAFFPCQTAGCRLRAMSFLDGHVACGRPVRAYL